MRLAGDRREIHWRLLNTQKSHLMWGIPTRIIESLRSPPRSSGPTIRLLKGEREGCKCWIGNIVYSSSLPSSPNRTVTVKKEILDLDGLLIWLCGLFYSYLGPWMVTHIVASIFIFLYWCRWRDIFLDVSFAVPLCVVQLTLWPLLQFYIVFLCGRHKTFICLVMTVFLCSEQITIQRARALDMLYVTRSGLFYALRSL